MKNGLSEEIFGAWIATKDNIIEMNKKAKENHWISLEEDNLIKLIKDKAHHLVVPISSNNSTRSISNPINCCVWIMLANENKRICFHMDFGFEDLKMLQRPSPKAMHMIVFMFLEYQYLVNLDRFV